LEEVVWLQPLGAFHLGERGIGLEETAGIVHADTLYAALVTSVATLEGTEAADALAGGTPRALISSAFPFAGPVRFYPRSMLPVPEGGFELPDEASWKDVQFVSERLLELQARGAPWPSVEVSCGGSVLVSAEEAAALRDAFGLRDLDEARFWGRTAVPRVVLDVACHRSGIWHFGRVSFREGAGWFFRVRYLDPGFSGVFRAAVRLLGDTGLGGDRSGGHGLFKPRFEAADPLGDASADRFVTLSPVYPPPGQAGRLLGPGSRYRWLTRGGWVSGARATPYRRRTVRMLAEGSLLEGEASLLWGGMADVTPLETPEPLPFRVFRYGFAFPVGVARWDGC
jgi:CRISPR-associated protein Csm4